MLFVVVTGRSAVASLRPRTVQEQTGPFATVGLLASAASRRHLHRIHSAASAHITAFPGSGAIRLLLRPLLRIVRVQRVRLFVHSEHVQPRSLFGLSAFVKTWHFVTSSRSSLIQATFRDRRFSTRQLLTINSNQTVKLLSPPFD
jgi:hypothetical protein